MTTEGLIKMLLEQIKLSEMQIERAEWSGLDLQYEKGYRDALKLALSMVRETKNDL